jgi:flagellar biosynthesis protein FlhF
MNVKRFIGRNSREAMQKVRLAFGDNAVVLSTKPCSEGIEIVAMPPESIEAIERFGDAPREPAPAPRAPARAPAAAPDWRVAEQAATPAAQAPVAQAAPQAAGRGLLARLRAAVPGATPAPAYQPSQLPSQFGLDADSPVQDDVGTLAMSTLSFQDYVRERMLKKREAELRAQAMKPVPVSPEAIEQRLSQRDGLGHADIPSYPELLAASANLPSHADDSLNHSAPTYGRVTSPAQHAPELMAAPRREARPAPAPARHEPDLNFAPDTGLDTSLDSLDEVPAPAPRAASRSSRSSRSESPAAPAATREQADMMTEIRAMKGMIEERFGALAFMERLQKSPRQAQLITRLIDCGFSPALIRKLGDSMPEDVADELAWASSVLQRNLNAGENDPSLEDQGGVFALVGSTGVGKTTSTAKLAAAFATKHGAANLGLVTLDAYRLGAHEQLRAYGRILGVPVHTAHDKVALEDLLDLLSAKKMVLIDTAGLAQRDTRTRELLEMLQHPSIKRILVVNAAQQGETIDDVLSAYKASQAKGIVLSKMDEAVKLGPALDALIRHRLKVVAVANGQRVPEDWHRLTAQALVQRALRSSGSQAWRMDVNDVNLLFTTPAPAAPAPKRSRSSGEPRRSGN